jgi:hypothetical protein
MSWQRVASNDISTQRMKVPGGWLYMVRPIGSGVALEFVPAVDAPATAEVTEEVVDAAWDAYAASGGDGSMRAAIEAADRARGLRP